MKERHDRFFSYIREKLQQIVAIGHDEYKLHKKVLYVSFLDSMSGLAYPAINSPGQRFVQFVRIFTAWDDCERVCTPHLNRALKLNPDPAYDKVRELVSGTLSKWRVNGQTPISEDLDAGVVGSHWPKGNDYKQIVKGVGLSHLKHTQLLYTYRNSLVHGFRAPSMDLEMPEDYRPYYLGHDSRDGTGVHFGLIYPTAFLYELCETALNGLEEHYRKNGIDPVAVMRGGRFWLSVLN